MKKIIIASVIASAVAGVFFAVKQPKMTDEQLIAHANKVIADTNALIAETNALLGNKS